VVDDAPAVVALRREVHPYLVRGIASTAQLIRHPPVGKDWKAFVAEVDGQVVGWVSASRNSAVPGNQVGQISLLQVKPAKQGQGIGSELLRAATAHLDARG
jgi:predicted N-acetyltransferase YhbS